MSFRHVVVGDVVTRVFAGVAQRMKVTAVEGDLITAGMGWQFDRDTGVEEDADLQWGLKFGRTGSYLKGETNGAEEQG